MDIFDIIGPVMIGPSSSHTAGAVRIGQCGSASAMAAGALVELMGGTPQMVSDAVAIALKCIMGLICDPVASLVECPCVKRNASGVANSLAATNMVLSGMESIIPADEVIDAMKSVGNLMSPLLKETSLGGVACPKMAKVIENKIGI